MDDTESSPGNDPGRQADDVAPDQDAEPTMNAPEEGRPDGLDALTEVEDEDEDESTGGDGTPS